MHLSHEELFTRMHCNPETGSLTWANSARPGWNGKECGALDDGYWRTKIDGKSYRNHQIVWFFVKGTWPREIDHKNRNRADNRITNLREVTHMENGRNQSKWKHNTSGTTGVNWHKRSRRWRAYVYVNKKQISCGYHGTIEEAATARRKVLDAHGFTSGHGSSR